MSVADRKPGVPGGVGSRSVKFPAESVGQVRRFVDDHLREVLREPSASDEISGDHQSLRLTIRVLPDHIEVTVGGESPTALFREWLGGVLRREGLSQESAARRLGVSLKTVNRWLRGHSEPRMRELRRVRDVFGEPPLS